MTRTEAPLVRHTAPDGRSWYEHGYYSSDTLGRRIEARVERWRDRPLEIVSQSRPAVSTLGESWDEARRIAACFLDAGVKPGDRVAIQLPNWSECVVAYLAGLHAGFVILPIVTIMGVKEVAFMMGDCGADVLVCPRSFRGKDFAPIAREVLDSGIARLAIMVGECDDIPGCESWDAFSRRADRPAPAGPNNPDDVALILYTSGTTADPKGARHTHNTLGAEFDSNLYAPDPEACSLCMFPAGHTAGMLGMLRPFLAGESVYFMDEWNAEVAVDIIHDKKVTCSSGTPFHLTQMTEVAERKGLDLSSLQTYIVGATNVTPAVVEAGLRYGIVSCRCYGSTEYPTASATWTHDAANKRAFTDGHLLSGCSIRFVDDDGRDLPAGEEGEILLNGPELCVGYTNGERNADTFIDGIWYRTGDVGRLDEEGFLTITDRKKDIVIRAGENISSREVEEALFRHPAIQEASVVPYPDPLMTERVCAFVVLNPGSTFTLADAQAHFTDLGLARQKVPERLEYVGDLPRTPIGKVKKSDLKAAIREKVARELAAATRA